MDSTMLHQCFRTETAPSDDGAHEAGERWICGCGNNFVYREGINRAGHSSMEWWPAPAVPKPRRSLLFGPRKG